MTLEGTKTPSAFSSGIIAPTLSNPYALTPKPALCGLFFCPFPNIVRSGFFVHHKIRTMPVLWAGLGATQSARSPSHKVMEALVEGRPVLWAGLGASLTNVSFGLCYDFGDGVMI